MSVISVVQFGNSPSMQGGIASVVAAMNDWTEEGLRVTSVPTVDSGGWWLRLLCFLRAFARAAMMPRNSIIHVHLSQRGSFIREGAIILLLSSRGFRVFTTIHGSGFGAFARKLPWLVRQVLQRCAGVFVLTREAYEIVSDLCPTTSVWQTVNMARQDSERLKWADRERRVVFAGEVGVRKGCDVLFDAWGRSGISGYQLVLYGPRTELAIPEWDSLHYRGSVPREVVKEDLRRAALMVLPSRAEALPMAVLEALACGTPVVSTDVGDLPAVVSGCGRLAAVGNARELRREISSLLSSTEFWEDASRAGFEKVAYQFSSDAVREVYLQKWLA